MPKPMEIDGAFGEGGGQILRTALALSLVTGKPFRIRNIRAGRPKPGLRKQHLAAVKAAGEIGRASVTGDIPGSVELEFHPGGRYGGNYTFAVGSAGSCSLVLQTVLPALLTAEKPSRVELSGGTHNPFAPTYHFLEHVFMPLLNCMGPSVRVQLQRWGFYPAGGGRMSVEVTPARRFDPLDLTVRGELVRGRVRAVSAGLPRHIAERECRSFAAAVNRDLAFEQKVEELRQEYGPGNTIMAEIRCANITELFSAFGRRGVPAEKVAGDLAGEVNTYLGVGAPVGPYLADQLLIPMAMAGKGLYRTAAPTRHTQTNRLVVQQFLEVAISMRQATAGVWEVEIGG